MNANSTELLKLFQHPVKFRMYLFSHLPNALFAGIRMDNLNDTSCEVSVPYKWFTKNPFHSTYFACLSMAAEMSTGALAMLHLYKRNPPVSMLIVKAESEYFKKATGRISFICEDGQLIKQTIEESIETRESKSTRARSVGRNNEGIMVAEFFFTWSFKAKNKLLL